MNDLFSERYGYIARQLQYEFLNAFSKAHLWDEINRFFFAKAKRMREENDHEYEIDKDCDDHAIDFYFSLHRDFWGRSIDDVEVDPARVTAGIKNVVINTMWHNTFDVIEALVRLSPELVPDKKRRKIFLKNFHAAINNVLQEQRCAYGMVNGIVLPNINNAEIVTITNALVDTNSIKTVNVHLEQAIKHYADRQNPIYTNAIKEAVLALESLLKIITGKPNVIMSDALKIVGKNRAFELHPLLNLSLDKLYTWTGDASGIRHANKKDKTSESDEAPEYDIEDAKLIIVTCCSFVSYLTAKATRNGIELK